jgi:hypothetical protein
MIHGQFMDIRSLHDLIGIPIRESGLTARSFPLERDSELDTSGDLVGAGDTGDSIGITTPCSITTLDSIPGVRRFITGTLSIVAEAGVADSVGATEVSTTLALLGILSAKTTGQPADLPSRATKPGRARERLADSTGAARREAFHRAEALALVAADFTVAGAGNQSVVKFLGDREF